MAYKPPQAAQFAQARARGSRPGVQSAARNSAHARDRARPVIEAIADLIKGGEVARNAYSRIAEEMNKRDDRARPPNGWDTDRIKKYMGQYADMLRAYLP